MKTAFICSMFLVQLGLDVLFSGFLDVNLTVNDKTELVFKGDHSIAKVHTEANPLIRVY